MWLPELTCEKSGGAQDWYFIAFCALSEAKGMAIKMGFFLLSFALRR